MDARVKPAHDASRVSSVRIAPFWTIAFLFRRGTRWLVRSLYFPVFCRFGIFHPRSHDLKHTHLLAPATHFCARGLHPCFTHPESRGGRSADPPPVPPHVASGCLRLLQRLIFLRLRRSSRRL